MRRALLLVPGLLAFGLLVPFGAAVAAAAEGDVASWVAALGSPDPALRLAAAMDIAERAPPSAGPRVVPALLGALHDPVPGIRRAAAEGLGRFDDPRTRAGLLHRLGAEGEPLALGAVALSLGRLGVSEATTRLVALARSHPVPSVRASAITALADLGGLDARATALQAIREPTFPDPDWAVRSAALLALARTGQAADVGVVLTAFREGGGEGHWFARAALASFVGAHDPDPLPLLRQLAVDPDPRVAVTAALGVARRGSVAALDALLRHTSPIARAAAASAAARAEVRAVYPRLQSMARFDRSAQVRWAAALALFRVEDPLGEDLVLEALGSKEPTVWAEAMAALGRRTGESHGRSAAAWREALRRWRQEGRGRERGQEGR